VTHIYKFIIIYSKN